SMVQITMGRSTKLHDAYVVELLESSEYKVKPITAVNGNMTFLPHASYKLLRSLADRSVCAIGDLLKVAVPSRAVRSETAFEAAAWATPVARTSGTRSTELTFDWVGQSVIRVEKALANGESVMVITPDYRDQAAFVAAIETKQIPFIDYASTQKSSARYQAFLTAQTEGAHLLVGNRATVYAPVQNLGLVIIKDEGDDSLTEQTAPYLSVREVALLRQQLENFDLHFVSASRSTDIQRLVELGYVIDESAKQPLPKVSFDPDNSRNSALAYVAIREGLASGAVLVQVASRGVAKSCYCRDCGERAKCKNCAGPLWIDSTSIPRCRWCNLQNLDFACTECRSTNLRQGYGGSTRTAAELGKSFPGAAVVESSLDKPVVQIKPGKRLVIATPGAEPTVSGGYAAVVILDASSSLHHDSLRSTERAVARWAEAISLLAPSGRAVIAGVPQTLGQKLSLWQLAEIASTELAERRELAFPPHVRMASVQGDIETIRKVLQEVQRKMPQIQVLGPISLNAGAKTENRFVIKFAYVDGLELAIELRAAIAAASAGPKTSASGRNERAIRVRMDDAEVI
ncbi:MAG: hypothetical protein ACKOWJ_05805, partial [Micrococcales bacterium]